ncbi:hypothetical protein, partial [Roseinatronobacter sp.]|uniref:hypothetical protein n=1 Tax=Roseinatronobacter sp. TaxID=1945755 RepID=UPI0025F13460
MFKNLQRELEKLGRMKEISVPIKLDSEGYLDKECPSEPCLFLFKIHGDDWSNIGKVSPRAVLPQQFFSSAK